LFSDLLALLLNCDDDDDDDADADTAQKSYDNIPSYLQTIITAHLLSVGWEGVNEHPIASKSRLAIILQKMPASLLRLSVVYALFSNVRVFVHQNVK